MAYLFKDLQHDAAQIDQSIDDLASHIANGVIHITAAERQEWNAKATTADVSAEAEARTQADGELQTAINAKAPSSDLTAEETARIAADAKQVAALADVIDSGAKNVLNLTSAQSQAGSGTLQYTVNSDFSITCTGKCGTSASFFSIPVNFPAGQYYFSGMPENGGSNSYRMELRTVSAQGTMYVNGDSADGVVINAATDFTGWFNIRVAANYDFGSTGKTISPMICLKTFWEISHKYVPYCPSQRELWSMIKALQT